MRLIKPAYWLWPLALWILVWGPEVRASDTLGFLGTSTAGNYLCEDAMITSDGGGDDNYGSDVISGSGLTASSTSHFVIRFPNLDDCATDSSVTAAEVDSGKIWLFTKSVPAGSAYILYKSIPVSWLEGTGTGATTAGVSWLYRDSANSPGVLWTQAGGDTSHVTFDSSSVTVDEAYVSFKVSKASCSTWVATPSINYGINFYRTQSGYGQWGTSEEATSGWRPRFTLYFTQGAGASTALAIGGNVVLGGGVVIGGK